MGQVHNELRRGPSVTIATKKIFGDTRSGSGIERYSETLQGIYDLWSRPDWALLLLEFVFQCYQEQSAVVGERCIIALENTATSSRLCLVRNVWVSTLTAGGQCRLALFKAVAEAAGIATIKGTTATSAGAVQTNDGRALPGSVSGVPGLVCWVGTDAGTLLGTNDELLTSINASEVATAKSVPYVLRPGDMLVIEGLTANAVQRAGFQGSVRLATPSELETIDQ